MKWVIAVLLVLCHFAVFVFVSSGCKAVPTSPVEYHPAWQHVPDSGLYALPWLEDPSAMDVLFAVGTWHLPDGRMVRGEDHTIYWADGTEMPLFILFNGTGLPDLYDVRGDGAVSTQDGCEILEFFGLPKLTFCPDEPVRELWRRHGQTRDVRFRIVNTIRTDHYEIRAKEGK